MKVADFQKCLRALADVISTKTPAKELTEAADALEPFAHHSMAEFATFLKLAEAKYRETRELPDGKPPKAVVPPKEKKASKTKEPAPTVDELLVAVESLKVRLRTDQTLTRDGIAAELARFEKLSQDALFGAVKTLGIQARQKNRPEAIKTIVAHTVSTQGGVERSDA